MCGPRNGQGRGGGPAMGLLQAIYILSRAESQGDTGLQANMASELLPVLVSQALTKVTDHSEASCAPCWAHKAP